MGGLAEAVAADSVESVARRVIALARMVIQRGHRLDDFSSISRKSSRVRTPRPRHLAQETISTVVRSDLSGNVQITFEHSHLADLGKP